MWSVDDSRRVLGGGWEDRGGSSSRDHLCSSGSIHDRRSSSRAASSKSSSRKATAAAAEGGARAWLQQLSTAAAGGKGVAAEEEKQSYWLRYNEKHLGSWRVFGILSGTVFTSRRLWSAVVSYWLLALALCLLILSVEPEASQLQYSSLKALVDYFSTIIGFLLGMYVSNSLARWWALHMHILNLWGCVDDLCMLGCSHILEQHETFHASPVAAAADYVQSALQRSPQYPPSPFLGTPQQQQQPCQRDLHLRLLLQQQRTLLLQRQQSLPQLPPRLTRQGSRPHLPQGMQQQLFQGEEEQQLLQASQQQRLKQQPQKLPPPSLPQQLQRVDTASLQQLRSTSQQRFLPPVSAQFQAAAHVDGQQQQKGGTSDQQDLDVSAAAAHHTPTAQAALHGAARPSAPEDQLTLRQHHQSFSQLPLQQEKPAFLSKKSFGRDLQVSCRGAGEDTQRGLHEVSTWEEPLPQQQQQQPDEETHLPPQQQEEQQLGGAELLEKAAAQQSHRTALVLQRREHEEEHLRWQQQQAAQRQQQQQAAHRQQQQVQQKGDNHSPALPQQQQEDAEKSRQSQQHAVSADWMSAVSSCSPDAGYKGDKSNKDCMQPTEQQRRLDFTKTEILHVILRLGMVAVHLTFDAAQRRDDDISYLYAAGLLEWQELQLLQGVPSKAQVTWLWLSQLGAHLARRGRLLYGANATRKWHEICSRGRGEVAACWAYVDTRLPFSYVHLLSILVHINNIFLAVLTGVGAAACVSRLLEAYVPATAAAAAAAAAAARSDTGPGAACEAVMTFARERSGGGPAAAAAKRSGAAERAKGDGTSAARLACVTPAVGAGGPGAAGSAAAGPGAAGAGAAGGEEQLLQRTAIWDITQLLLVHVMFMLVMPLFYHAMILLAQTISNPFECKSISFPRALYIRNMQAECLSFFVVGQRGPPYFSSAPAGSPVQPPQPQQQPKIPMLPPPLLPMPPPSAGSPPFATPAPGSFSSSAPATAATASAFLHTSL